jgi:hypothetical protein
MPKLKNESRQPSFTNYKPLSETEEDAAKRMIEDDLLMVEIEDWGYHVAPDISVGDKRMSIKLNLQFTQPEGIEVPVRQFHLKLKTRGGRVLAESVEHTIVHGQPLKVTAGREIGMVWDLMLDEIPDDARSIVMPKIRGEKKASIDGDEVIYHSDEQEAKEGADEDETSSSEDQTEDD